MIFSSDPTVWLKDLFIDAGLSYSLSSFLSTVVVLVSIALISWLANLIAKAIILKVVTGIVKKSKTQWDDIFLKQKVFIRLSHFAPALIIWFMSGWALKPYIFWLTLVHNLTYIYMLCVGMIVINSFIESWHRIYQMLPIARHRNIKGYVQLVKIFVILVTILIIISVVFKREVSTLLAGIGVMASVLILVFKDTLLGLAASIQLSANKMLKVGDWITIPGRDVDGTVTDISLNTVKVQNFDKTIITVPTYALVQDSFQNWIGMEEAGARRIKRPIFIDMKSIKFLDSSLRERLYRIPGLKEYIEMTENIGVKGTQKTSENDNQFLTYNKLTNLGLFRYYGETWLKNHPKTAKDQALIIRHRSPEGNGLPLEILLFSKDNQFMGYETFQNEIIEHLLAIINEFELKVFQQPTGNDLLELSGTKNVKNL
ncbi:MAG: mechanosensitive ion channel protein MscS [Odoribacter sp.]|nr:mechanosensitive ion channel protein MscS [Odoribacter sp.]